MPQYARPDADLTVGSFTNQLGANTNLFQTLDEVSADDADYIQSAESPTSNVYVCRLGDITDPTASVGHTMRMRTSVDQDGQEALDFVQQLRQGYTNEGAQGTLIASQSRTGVDTTTWVTSSYNLSAGEADAITDYTALAYRFTVNKP